MADDKTTKSSSGSGSGRKAPAAESGDPAVHKALADLQTARLNGDDDGVKAAVKALADLGVAAE